MATFPDYLYRLTPRDEQVTPLEIVIESANNTLNNVQVDATLYTVPQGKMFNLKSVALASESPVANTPQELKLNVTYGGSTIRLIQSPMVVRVGTTLDFGAYSQFTDVWLPSGAVIYARAEFDVAAATNKVIGSITGVLVPRGNFAV